MNITAAISDPQQKTAGEALQDALIDLLDLSLQCKQAHWTVVGRGFRSIHLELDEIVAAARAGADDVAERAAAIGVLPDGRAPSVAERSGLPQPEVGPLPVARVVDHVVGLLTEITGRFHERIARTESEPVTQDLLIGITHTLEKQSWMLQAQQG